MNSSPSFWSFPRDEGAARPGLSVVATPLGHLRDVSLRALDILAHSNLVLCEDKRITGRLLNRYGISAASLENYHDRNGARKRPAILQKLREGAKVALVSDAGTPLISDPGYKLICACIEENIPLWPVPGASAPVAALSVAGLPTDSFFFAGFPPARSKARLQFFQSLANHKASLIFFEAPHRLPESLADMERIFKARPAGLFREMTKYHEQYCRASLASLLDQVKTGNIPQKGECVIIIAPPDEESNDARQEEEQKIDKMLKADMKTMSLRKAVDRASSVSTLPRRHIYGRALEIGEKLKPGKKPGKKPEKKSEKKANRP